MRLWALILAVLAVENQLFFQAPYIASATNDRVKLAYSIGETIVKVVALTEAGEVDYTKNQTNRIGNHFYGSVSVSLAQGFMNWTLEDFGGQTAKCQTKLRPSVTIGNNQEQDSCLASGCYQAFRNDGWCDAICLNPACGYDGEDCREADVLGVLKCSPSSIGNGICDPACNSPLAFFDGGDCSSPCLRTGCPRYALGNGVCDKKCNNEACSYDHGDCFAATCSRGCSVASLGNGHCDVECNTASCDFDHGDCVSAKHHCPGEESNFLDHLCRPITCLSLGCTPSMAINKVCDEQCNNPVCGYDGKQCIQKHLCKNHGCSTEDIGDGNCDMDCFYKECAYDHGDCDGVKSVCWSGCMLRFVGNGICDEQCNVPQCRFDGGDCGSQRCVDSCFKEWLGDGVCDEPCNNASCNLDNGDCGLGASPPSVSSGEVTVSGVKYKAETECIRSQGTMLVVGICTVAYSFL